MNYILLYTILIFRVKMHTSAKKDVSKKEFVLDYHMINVKTTDGNIFQTKSN